jgi:mannosyltransferase
MNSQLLANAVPSEAARKAQAYAPVAVMVAAIITRLLGIASRPIWYDEAFAILFSEKGPAAMVAGTLTTTGSVAADVHPLGYYTLLWGWMRLFGESLVAVRLLSILAGLGIVAVIMLLARQLFNPPTALVAGALAALAPFQVHYSQEIRMYAFLCLWLMLATYAYWRLSHSSAWTWPLLFGLFAGLAQYTQNLAAFYLAALALWPLITRNWAALKRVALGTCLALLLYLPWLVHLPAQFARIDRGYWVLRPDFYRLLVLPVIFVVNLPLPQTLLAPGLFIGLSVTALALLRTFRAISQRQPTLQSGLWLLYLSFFPALLMFLVSQWKPVYLERALLPSGAIFLVWVAWALVEAQAINPLHILTAVLVVLGFGMGLYEHVAVSGGIYGPFHAMIQDLESRRQAGDVIIHSNKLSMLPAVYFDRTIPETYVADPPGSAEDTLAPATQQVLDLMAQPSIESAAAGADRIWFVIFDASNQEFMQAGYPRHPQLTWLMEHYTEVEQRNWDTMTVYLFEKAP